MAAFYHLDRGRRRLLIVPPKCGISSLGGLGLVPINRELAESFNAEGFFTAATARHPFDRIVSALYQHLWDESLTFAERYERNRHDQHVAPQAPALAGLRIDAFTPFEHAPRLWHELGYRNYQHKNRGLRRPARWQDEPFDWSAIAEDYACDFALWTRWSAS